MSSHTGKNSSFNDTSYGVNVFFGTLGKQVRKTTAIVNCTQHGTSSGEQEFRFILHPPAFDECTSTFGEQVEILLRTASAKAGKLLCS